MVEMAPSNKGKGKGKGKSSREGGARIVELMEEVREGQTPHGDREEGETLSGEENGEEQLRLEALRQKLRNPRKLTKRLDRWGLLGISGNFFKHFGHVECG